MPRFDKLPARWAEQASVTFVVGRQAQGDSNFIVKSIADYPFTQLPF